MKPNFLSRRSIAIAGQAILVFAEFVLYAEIVYRALGLPDFVPIPSINSFLIIVSAQLYYYCKFQSSSPAVAAFLRWFSFLFLLASHLFLSVFVSKGFLSLGCWWELTIPVVKILLALSTWDSKRFLAP